jgi:hypothetical protein
MFQVLQIFYKCLRNRVPIRPSLSIDGRDKAQTNELRFSKDNWMKSCRCKLGVLWQEFVTKTLHGLNVHRLGRMIFQPSSQPVDVIVDGTTIRIVFIFPDLIE